MQILLLIPHKSPFLYGWSRPVSYGNERGTLHPPDFQK